MDGPGDTVPVDPRDARIAELERENLRLRGQLDDLHARFREATECLVPDGG